MALAQALTPHTSGQNEHGHFLLTIKRNELIGIQMPDPVQERTLPFGSGTSLLLMKQINRAMGLCNGARQNLVLLPGNEITQRDLRTNKALYARAREYGYRTIRPITMALLLHQASDEELHRECFENIVGLIAPSAGLYVGWSLDGSRRLGTSIPDRPLKRTKERPAKHFWGNNNAFVFETDP